MKLPESEWPFSRVCAIQELQQEPRVVKIANTKPKDSLAVRIDISRYSDYTRLVRVTAKVLAMLRTDYRPSFRNAARVLEPADVAKAERFWILQAQKTMSSDMKRGRFRRLCPRVREDGIIVVGEGADKWLEMSYNQRKVSLLPFRHELSRLYAKHIHEEGHQGVSATTSKVRSRFWVIGLPRIVRSIRYNCVTCKKLDKKTMTQLMGRLPLERLTPAPAWNCATVDLFGPFRIRGEVQKRTTDKGYRSL